jgi:AcrR family transcriptional regulator
MSSKRELNKKERRQRILEISDEMFSSKGYEKTSISSIAKKAGLGVGTVYNYFDSKDDIFTVVYGQKFGVDYEVDVESIVIDQLSPLKPIFDYIERTEKILKKVPIWLFQELIRIGTKNKKLMKALMSFDFKMIEDLEKIIIKIRNQGYIKNQVKPSILAEMLYSVYMYELLLYFYSDDVEIQQAFQQGREKAQLLLESYVVIRSETNAKNCSEG